MAPKNLTTVLGAEHFDELRMCSTIAGDRDHFCENLEFSRSNLPGFELVRLAGGHYKNCAFASMLFTREYLPYTTFENCAFHGSRFFDVDFRNVWFRNCLIHGIFSGCTFSEECAMERCDLSTLDLIAPAIEDEGELSGVIYLGYHEGYHTFAYCDPKGRLKIRRGCRNFLYSEALEHWDCDKHSRRRTRALVLALPDLFEADGVIVNSHFLGFDMEKEDSCHDIE